MRTKMPTALGEEVEEEESRSPPPHPLPEFEIQVVAALSAALSCGAGGRRLETDTSFMPSEPSDSTSATSIVDDLPSRRPDLAGTLTAEQRAGIEELGQHFGLPALA